MDATCGWCGAPIGTWNEALGARAEAGACVLCASFIRTNRLLTLRDYMHDVPAPVLYVGAAGIIRGCNSAGEQALARSSSEMEGSRGGDVISCAYAALPGGCGGTEQCRSCPILTPVLSTMNAGYTFDGVQGSRPIRQGLRTIETCFTFSTRLIEDVVLLRVDGMARRDRAAVLSHDDSPNSPSKRANRSRR
jgi:hypothetical protein